MPDNAPERVFIDWEIVKEAGGCTGIFFEKGTSTNETPYARIVPPPEAVKKLVETLAEEIERDARAPAR